MSCYICPQEILETVLKAQMMCESSRAKYDEGIAELWYDIVRANYEAYRDRYDDEIPDELEEMYPVPFTLTGWIFDQKKPSKLERYDALKEYMYQCAEGNYHERPGYYKCRWCLNSMLEDYVKAEGKEQEPAVGETFELDDIKYERIA